MNRNRLRVRPWLAIVILALAVPASAEWKEKVLYSFQGGTNDGSVPAGGVVFDPQGNLYGATTDGGPATCKPIGGACGTVFQLSHPAQKSGSWTETLIYRFQGKGSNDGSVPNSGLIRDAAGNLYGVTAYGGTGNCILLGVPAGCGTVYELSPPKQKGGAWKETILYSFPTSNQGYLPNGNLVFDGTGNLYGATVFGGSKGTTCDKFYGGQCGTIFELSPPKTKGGKWTEKVLHSFAGGTDGANPSGGLVLDSKGAIYGTTPMGGNQLCNFGNGKVGCGIAFELIPGRKGVAWTERFLHRFTDGKDGAGPNGGLIFDAKGSLYGSAGGGGVNLDGVVFRLTPTKVGRWVEDVLYAFTDKGDGFGPGPMTFDDRGNLYGAAFGGKHFRGTLFELQPERRGWIFSLRYTFTGAPDGAYPESRLIFDGAGNLYSTTQGGGTGQACQGGCGTAFQLRPPTKKGSAWTEKQLHVFTDGNDGSLPRAGTIFDSNGNLYGVAFGNAFSTCASVQEIRPLERNDPIRLLQSRWRGMRTRGQSNPRQLWQTLWHDVLWLRRGTLR